MKRKIVNLALVLSLAVVPMASECSSSSGGGGSDDPVGTQNDPVQGKKEGRRCVTPGQFGETDDGVLLICSTETKPHRHGDKKVDGETSPRWHRF